MTVATTERLILRHVHIRDAEAFEAVFCDPEVMRFGRGQQSPEWVVEWIQRCLANYHERWGFGHYAVVERASGAVAGFCGLAYYPDLGGAAEVEIGYRLAQPYWGKGYATEAATAVRDYGFYTLSMTRLVAIIDPGNTRSMRVADKLGMHHEKDVMLEGYSHADRLYVVSFR